MRLSYFSITKIPKGVMKNLFHPKRITLLTTLNICMIKKYNNLKFVSHIFINESKLISNSNFYLFYFS